MGKEKFTPGPWHKKGKRVFWAKPNRDLPKDDLFNGLVCICATTEDAPPEAIEEVCANAALIAQAPKLYNALEEACKEFCRLCPAFDFGKLACGGKTGKCFCDKWMKVLAKARGEMKE